MLIGLSALAIGFTGSAGATYETNPTSNVVGAECSVVAAGVSTTAFNTPGDGKKSDGKLQVAVSGAPNAVLIEVLDPAGPQITTAAVQHVTSGCVACRETDGQSGSVMVYAATHNKKK